MELAKYREAMNAIKRSEWSSLKKLLSTAKAAQVLALLQSYVKAYQDTDKAEEEFGRYMEQWHETSTPEELEQLWAGRRKLGDAWDATVCVEQSILGELIALAGKPDTEHE